MAYPAMDKATYEAFLTALHKIVHDPRRSADKADDLLAAMNDQDKTNLNELLSWDIDLEE